MHEKIERKKYAVRGGGAVMSGRGLLSRHVWLAAGAACLLACSSLRAGPSTMPVGYGSEGLDYPPGIVVNQTPPRTVELLGQALHRAGLESDRAHYLHELGVTRMKQAARLVAAYLDSADAVLRAVAVEAAGQIGDSSLAGGVNKLLDDKDAEVRRAALRASVMLAGGTQAKADIVGRMLKDADHSVVVEAMSLAQASNAPQVAAMVGNSSQAIAIEAVKTLGRLGVKDQAGAVAALLKSSDLAMQAAAIETAGQLGDTPSLGTIVGLLKDSNPTIRRAAMRAVVRLAPADEQQKLAMDKLLNDSDPTVREAACGAFAKYPLESAVDVLVKQLSSEYIPLHDAAREALSHSASEAMTGKIIAQAVILLREENWRRKEDGSFLLGHYRSQAALEDHIAVIDNYPSATYTKVDWDLYTQAVRSLGRIGNDKAGPPLIPLLAKAPITMGELMSSTVSLDAEEAALVTVGELKFSGALPQVWRIVNGSGQEEPENMRAAAVWALGAITARDDAKSNEAFTKIVTEYESNSPSALFEAAKWLGHRHVTSAADALKIAASHSKDPRARFAAHWAYEQITGTTVAYTPPDVPFRAETSIIDLTGSNVP